MFENVLDWLLKNAYWIFSGIGATVIASFLIKSSYKYNKQIQKSGDSSINIQVGGNAEINKKIDK